MLRIGGLAILIAVVLPALLGYAASFSVSPVVSQEFHVAVEDVETEQIGGPAPEPLTSSIVSTEGEKAGAPGLLPGETGCPGAEPAADGPNSCVAEATPGEELPALAAEPAPPPEPEIDAPDKEPAPFDANPAPFFSLDPGGQ